MIMSELCTLLQAGKDVDVEFAKGVGDLEGYPEQGMRATIIGVTPPDHDDVMKVRVNFTKYDDFNRSFESRTYWGNLYLGQDPASSNYTARETGWYKVEEDLYVMASDPVEKFMTILDRNELFDAWSAGDRKVSYVAWLENLVRSHAVPT